MLNLTPPARPFFYARLRTLRRNTSTSESLRRIQEELLYNLIKKSLKTEIGSRNGFKKFLESRHNFVTKYSDTLPVVEYEDIRGDIMRMVDGERDVFWPGRVLRFAQSSGTSGGKSKFIPITSEGLRVNHFGGASDAVALYLGNFSKSKLFGGKSFILGGSYANELSGLPADVRVGDLSATLINEINPVVNLFRVPDKSTALMADWNKKLPLLVEKALGENITNISGVPSWFMTVIEHIIQRAGAQTIHDVWPNLEVFFHGGISFEPYREQYARLVNADKMRYVENYNASEGFFAVQDLPHAGHGMLLIPDRGVFYEFRDSRGNIFRSWEVKEGETYELVITSVNGLWRYSIGDTVRIETLNPLRITIAGRTKSYINAFGEELMVHNAEKAIAVACKIHGCRVKDYTVAPVFALADGTRGRHQWLIEWIDSPESVNAFAATLDKALRDENSDYAAKRSGGIFMDGPLVTSAPAGLFDKWLGLTGKLGGQRKVPRLSNSRETIEKLLALI